MKDLSEGDVLQYFVPVPRPADDEFYNEILYPTGFNPDNGTEANEGDNDILLPPLMDS